MLYPSVGLLFWAFCPICLSVSTIADILANNEKKIPTQNLSRPLDVRLGFYLESIGNFRSSEMSFDVDMYAYMSWTDHRLQHNFDDFVLVNNDEIRQQLWLPDLYFANAIQAKVHEVTVPNFNMFIDRDGTVAYSCRFTMQISCNLKLKNYPMDIQKCGIRILSYAYIAKQVNVTWFEDNPIRFNPEIGLPEFEITNVSANYCNGTYRYAVTKDKHKIDDFSCLMGNIYLSRSIGYNLVQSYIPTGLIVMISWVSFWIDRRAVPARVTLSFTTLVSLTTLGNGLRFGLPQVSYAKAIDLWYGACMFFVFCALLEFAIINSYMRKSEKYDQMAKKFLAHRNELHTGGEVSLKNVEKAINGFENDENNKSPRLLRVNMAFGAKTKSTASRRTSPKTSQPSTPLLNNVPKSPILRKPSSTKDNNGNGAVRSERADTNSPKWTFAEDVQRRLLARPPSRTGVPLFPRDAPIYNRDASERIKFVDEEFQMAVMNGGMNDSLSSYDNMSSQRSRTFRREELEISDDDEEAWDKAVQQKRNTPRTVCATEKGSSIYYHADKSNDGDFAKRRAQSRRRQSAYRLSVCESAYVTMSKSFSRTALQIDKSCRYLFPIAFVGWNLFYWWYYLILQKSRQYLSMVEL